MPSIVRLIQYSLRQRMMLLLICVLTVVTSAVTALEPWPLKILVDHALGNITIPDLLRSGLERLSLSPTPATLIVAAAAAGFGLFILRSLIDTSLNWAWTIASQRMVNDLAADLFHKLQRLSLLFHSRRTVGGFLSCLTGDTWCVYSVTSSLLISPMQHALTLVAVGSIAWRMDPILAALTLLIAPVLAGSSIFFGRRLKRRNKLNREAQSRLLSFVHQTLTVIPIVQAFGTEDRNNHQFRRLSTDAVERAQRNSLLKNTQGLVNGLTRTIGVAIVIYLGGQRVLSEAPSEAMTVGSLLLFISYQRAIQGALQGLLGTYASLKSTEASVDRVFGILDAEQDVRDAPGARPLKTAPRDQRGRVRLDNVIFGYRPDSPVLRGVSLEALPGESIAIVGPTGVGKSTLASLIPRFYDPWEGHVLVNGQDVRQVKLRSLRNEIALVLQEPFLFPLTVAENIAYGRPDASRDAIVEAAVAANADEFVRRLPQGYDTIIGERGATLSGGEKQRLSIARALLKDASILILDEPTSSLDVHTEELLLDALGRLMSGRTTFVISHRLSTTRMADRIVVLKEGRIAEDGTHESLLAAGGLYYALHSLQTAPYSREVVA